LLATIIDKLQVLALRRPRALIIVAQVLDGLLRQQVELLDDEDLRRSTRTRTRVGAGRTTRQRSGNR
jgi:hypothetical protein